MGSVDLENLKTNVRNKMLEAYKQKGLDFALKLARVVRDRNLATMLPSSDAANNVRGELCEAVAEICIVDYMNKLGRKDYRLFKGLVLDDYYNTSSDFTTETDLTLVTPECVYIIECKSYYGKKVLTKECTLTTTHSIDVFSQNVLHLQSMRKLIDNFSDGKPAYKLVLFSFAKGEIEDKRDEANKKRMQVVTEDTFTKMFTSGTKHWDFKRVCTLLERVESHSTKGKREQHVAYVRGRHS